MHSVPAINDTRFRGQDKITLGLPASLPRVFVHLLVSGTVLRIQIDTLVYLQFLSLFSDQPSDSSSTQPTTNQSTTDARPKPPGKAKSTLHSKCLCTKHDFHNVMYAVVSKIQCYSTVSLVPRPLIEGLVTIARACVKFRSNRVIIGTFRCSLLYSCLSQGSDIFAWFLTGFGKSLCYQSSVYNQRAFPCF